MNLSPKQRVYGGVLIVCASVFLIDKLLLAPSEAAAQPPTSDVVEGPVAATSDTTPAAGVDRESSDQALARRLESIAESMPWPASETPDAFRPSEQWVPSDHGVPDEFASRAQRIERFRSEYRLTAVMSGEPGYAVVNGTAHRVGRSVDGFTLVAVGDRSAVFEHDGVAVELTLPR